MPHTNNTYYCMAQDTNGNNRIPVAHTHTHTQTGPYLWALYVRTCMHTFTHTIIILQSHYYYTSIHILTFVQSHIAHVRAYRIQIITRSRTMTYRHIGAYRNRPFMLIILLQLMVIIIILLILIVGNINNQ